MCLSLTLFWMSSFEKFEQHSKGQCDLLTVSFTQVTNKICLTSLESQLNSGSHNCILRLLFLTHSSDSSKKKDCRVDHRIDGSHGHSCPDHHTGGVAEEKHGCHIDDVGGKPTQNVGSSDDNHLHKKCSGISILIRFTSIPLGLIEVDQQSDVHDNNSHRH